MANLRNKKLYNGALVAQDYQTGELVAYVGSADPYATKATKKFQPRFDVLADGWRQPGSAFKPIVYATGIEDRKITAATMFMDVVTDFGGGYTPTDADNTERGPVRVEDALRFSLNIPAVKAMAVIGNDRGPGPGRDDGRQLPERPDERRPLVRAGRRGGPPPGSRAGLRRARRRRPAGGPDHDRDRDRAATASSCWGRARGPRPSRRSAPTPRRSSRTSWPATPTPRSTRSGASSRSWTATSGGRPRSRRAPTTTPGT